MIKDSKIREIGKEVISIESQAVSELVSRVDSNFVLACRKLFDCKGRIVVIGMGKSGHVACKIAATLASTGSPAFFVHAGEANHGDLGMIKSDDVILAISNSGNTSEILSILPIIKIKKVTLITLTGNPDSKLAKEANININICVKKEACPLGIVPTSSTTATLVMGDALAIALLNMRGFTKNDFALSHPGGTLGKRLLLKVDDLMHKGESIPVVHEIDKLNQVLIEMTKKGLGMTSVLDKDDNLVGIFTDGDLRRVLDNEINLKKSSICDVMVKNYRTISSGMLAVDALDLMEKHKITSLIITEKDSKNKMIGIVHIHDILESNIA